MARALQLLAVELKAGLVAGLRRGLQVLISNLDGMLHGIPAVGPIDASFSTVAGNGPGRVPHL